MNTVILQLEDSDLDAELIALRLARPAGNPELVRACDRAGFIAALQDKKHFDIILSDYQLPDIDGVEALQLSRKHRPDVPFLFVSGALGEDLAVEMLKLGATDYVLKHRLERLAPAIERALRETHERADRRIAEEAARVASERLALAQTASRSGVFDWLIPEGRVFWSPELEDLYGIPRGSFEQTYEAWARRIVPEDAIVVGNVVQRCMKELIENIEYEFRIILPDGRRRWTAGKARFFFGPEGFPLRMVGINLDINDRKEMEERLRRGEESLRLAHEAGRLGAWEFDPATGIVTCSDVFKANLGLPPSAVISQATLLSSIHPEDRAMVTRRMEHTLTIGAGYEVRCRVIWPDSSVHWIQMRGRTVNGGDSLVRMAGVSLDVTDQVLREEAIRRQNKRLRLLTDAAELLLSATDPQKMLWDLFDRLSADLELSHYFHFTPSQDGRELQLTSYAGIPSTNAEQIRRLAFGQAVCGTVAQTRKPIVANSVQSSADPLVDLIRTFGVEAYTCSPLLAGDQFLGTLSFGVSNRDQFSEEDIDVLRTISHYAAMAKERYRLAAEANERAARLKEQDQRKDEFLALLAHELRNPLAPLRNGLEILRLSKGIGDAADRARETMSRQLAHMVRLIDDLLDISRINQNKLHLQRSRVSLTEVVESAIEAAHPLINAAGHTLTVTLPSTPIYLDADLTRLAQVFSNLLTNSAKYTPPGGKIVLTAMIRASEVVVIVRDNGLGIPTDYLPRIFDMFSQADRVTERVSGGLGIGLALVKGLVEMHGGSVEAQSDGPGTGSTFTVLLRLPDPLPNESTNDEQSSGGSGRTNKQARKRCILVVDDNLDSAESLGQLLELMGNDVHCAHDGVEAVEVATRIRPDLILMDVGMPRMNGLDATAQIRMHDWAKSITIVALTGWGQDADRVRSQAAGCNRHLVKPVTRSDLERLLNETPKPAS